MKIKTLFFILSFLFTFQGWAYDVPPLRSSVQDEVGLLNPSAVVQIQQITQALYDHDQTQLQVYIPKSLNGEPIESVAIQIFDKWKLGDAKKDNGILFIVAPNERRLRIEVGQGYEGALPDVIAKRIISDVVTPYFKNGQFDEGVLAGVQNIQKYIFEGQLDIKEQPRQRSRGGSLPPGIIIVFIILVILFGRMGGGGRGRGGGFYGGGWSGGGGGFGGGGWSGGGGSSSGGGSSGSW